MILTINFHTILQYKNKNKKSVHIKKGKITRFSTSLRILLSSEAPLYPLTVTGLRYPKGISINDSKYTILPLKVSSLKHLFLFRLNYEHEK